MSLPPEAKIAEAATPGVGAITPFRRSELLDPCVDGAEEPKSFAIAARSTVESLSVSTATGGGATNTHVQCASCQANTSVSAIVTTAPNQFVFASVPAGNVAMRELSL